MGRIPDGCQQYAPHPKKVGDMKRINARYYIQVCACVAFSRGEFFVSVARDNLRTGSNRPHRAIYAHRS